MVIGWLTQPHPDETICGDSCGYWQHHDSYWLAMVDGLGHGKEAAIASSRAIECIERNLNGSCVEIFRLCDEALYATRGVAMALAQVDRQSGRAKVAAVGNIRVVRVTAGHLYHLGGVWGIVGGGYQKLIPEEVILLPDDLLVLFSDGYDESIPLQSLYYQSTLTPQQLVDLSLPLVRGNDDAAMMIYRHQQEG
jgi:phosphoserine phosphatase RsbX